MKSNRCCDGCFWQDTCTETRPCDYYYNVFSSFAQDAVSYAEKIYRENAEEYEESIREV